VKEIEAATNGAIADNVYEAVWRSRYAAEKPKPRLHLQPGFSILRDLIWKRNDC
jgi:hypothetical protein